MSTVKVKVKVSTLITHLEKALAEREARFKNQEKERAKYEKELEKYNLAVTKLIKSGKGIVDEVNKMTYYGQRKRKGMAQFGATIFVKIGSLPDEPEAPTTYADYQYNRERDEIQQAIRVLKLTDDTLVSASTYASVAKYL